MAMPIQIAAMLSIAAGRVIGVACARIRSALPLAPIGAALAFRSTDAADADPFPPGAGPCHDPSW